MLLAGPSGSGKTYTSLLIATALCPPDAKILLIDTEKDSAKTYADEFEFHHLPWRAPFDAVALAQTLRDVRAADGWGAVIVDSFTHFWRGQGGILDVAGGKWTGWNDARPMHDDVVDAVLSIDAHIVLCARMKQEHTQVEENGRKVVKKLGMAVQQDDNLEYEVNVAVEMDMAHTMHVTKSRTRAVPVGSEFIGGTAERFAGVYRAWLSEGEPVIDAEQREKLVGVLNTIDDAPTRQRAKDDFLHTFGRPEFILASRFDEACEWVADRALGVAEPADRAEGETPPDAPAKEHGETPPDVPTPEATTGRAASTVDAPALNDPPEPAAPETAAQSPVNPATGNQASADAMSAADARSAIEAEVTAMGDAEVTAALRLYRPRGPLGMPKQQRQRLVDERVKATIPV